MTRRSSQSFFLAAIALFAIGVACSKEDAPTTPTSIFGPQPPATFRIDDQPCVAPAIGAVSCRFVVTSPGIFVPIPVNGPAEYDSSNSYNWRFTNPANGRGVEVNGVAWRPPMDCTFIPGTPGVSTYTISVTLTVYKIREYFTTGTGTVQITRPPGACGT